MTRAGGPVELLEREDELADLRAALLSPTGVAVLVEGEAGIGKSSVVEAACALGRESGRRVLSAVGAELEHEFAFGVVRQLLADGPDAHPVDAAWTGAASSPAETLHLLQATLATMARSTPLLVAVDDLQWCDVASLRFLGFLVRRLGPLPVVLVAAHRPAEDSLRHELIADLHAASTRVVLRPGPLSLPATRAFLRGQLGYEPADDVVRACLSTTAGNPLFLGELVRLLRERSSVTAAATADISTLGPQALAGHVRQRLGRQHPHVLALAQAVAVLGTGASPPLAAQLAGLDQQQVSAASDTLVRLGLLAGDRSVAYVHPLLRRAVYASIPGSVRHSLHERAAELMAQAQAPLERQAAHHLEAPPTGSARRVAILLGTAEQAWRRGSPDSTIAYLERALAEPPPPGLVAEIRRRLGACQAYVLDFEAAEANIRAAMAASGTPRELALAGYTLARLLESYNRVADAEGVLLSVSRDREVVGGRLAARIDAELVGYARILLSSAGGFTARLAALEQFDEADYRMVPSIVSAMTALGLAAAGGSATEVRAAAEPALSRSDLTAVMGGLYFLVHALLAVGDFEDARRELVRAVERAHREGQSVAVSVASSHLAWEALARGDLPEVERWVNEGLSVPKVPGNAADELAAFGIELALERGDVAAATRILAATGPPRPVLTTHCMKLQLARARLELETGRPDRAVVELRLLQDAYRRWDATAILDRPWRSLLARALAATGQTEEARQLAAEQLALARHVGSTGATGAALRVVAALEPLPLRVELLHEATVLLDQSPARLELAYARHDLAVALTASQRGFDARQQAREALSLAESCGADRLRSTVAAHLQRAGGRPGTVARTGPASLTVAERRVAELAAGGATNKKIAHTLFVTEKTVENHLRHVLRKLGASSRRELPELLGRGEGAVGEISPRAGGPWS